MFNFLKKKKELKIPTPPSDTNLPSFPSPKDLEKPSEAEIQEAVGSQAQTPLQKQKQRVIEKEKLGLSEIREHHVVKPIFIHAPTYKALIDEVSQMKAQLVEADDIVETLENFKEDQDKAYRSWQSNIKDIHGKLIYVDEVLFKR
ncbi:MAG: hypothetical protein KAT77_02620 [Nanoarchaeota archaeon]|nr:hypothetical protein [Nanoarchaeota archaeon]